MAARVKTIYVAEIGGKFGATFENRDDIPAGAFFMVMRDTRKDRAVKRAKDALKRTREVLATAA